MSVVIITGSAGLIGSEAAGFFSELGFDVVGIDNNLRETFFGPDASTLWRKNQLISKLGRKYKHYDVDLRDFDQILKICNQYRSNIDLVIHCAAQPSHDWAARAPLIDFSVNANGTLNILEAVRQVAPESPFIFTSTNKVYGDSPNQLPLVELEKRWEIDPSHIYKNGIDENMSIDQNLHSIFGASKVAADLMVQEYGRYFGMKTVCFRCGCLTGPNHSGTMLHGFLAYLLKCCVIQKPYTVFGYKGKQVRDNIHSLDMVNAFHAFYKNPRSGEVYNMGGGKYANCSMIEAIELCEKISGEKMQWHYSEQNRIGDHIWYISSLAKFERHFPEWKITFQVEEILKDIYEKNHQRWLDEKNND